MPQGEVLSDHTAETHPADGGVVDAEFVEELGDVIGHPVTNPSPPPDRRRAADAARVEHDHPMLVREALHLCVPHAHPRTYGADEHQCPPVNRHLIVDRTGTCVQNRHQNASPSARSATPFELMFNTVDAQPAPYSGDALRPIGPLQSS